MNKFWALLFLLVPILGCATFIAAPYFNIWLPRDVSETGHKIDHLFYVILYLTGAIFIGIEVLLFWYMWRYDEKTNKDPVKFVHGILSLEIAWSIIPGIILLFIAIYQLDSWKNIGKSVDNRALQARVKMLLEFVN